MAPPKSLPTTYGGFMETSRSGPSGRRLLERTAKWARRHRTAVAASISFLLLAVVTLAASTVLIAHQQREAERQRDEARQAVDDMYTDVAMQWLDQQAALEPVQQKFLRKALDYYQNFASKSNTDPGVRLKTAVAYSRVGTIQEKLGNSSEAKAACHRAIEIFEKLMAEEPSVREYRRELANSEVTLARLVWATGPQAEAESLVRRAIALLESVSTDASWEPQYLHEQARNYNNLARMLRGTNPQECEQAIRRAIFLSEKLAAGSPSVPESLRSLALAHTNLGLVLCDMGRQAEAEPAYRRAIAVSEKLAAEAPTPPENRVILALSLDNLGQFLADMDRSSEAEAMYRRAIELEEKVAAESPSVPRYRERLAMTCGNLGNLLSNGNRRKEAEPLLRRSASLFEKLAAESPSAPGYQRFLAQSHHGLGLLLEQTGRFVEAEQEYRRAIPLRERLAVEAPSVPGHRRDLAASEHMLSNLLHRAGRSMEAEQEYGRVVALLAKLADAESRDERAWMLATIPYPRLRDPQLALQLASKTIEEKPQAGNYWETLGVAQLRVGDWKAAVEALEKSMELGNGGGPSGWFCLAMAHWQQGEKDKARSWYGKSVQWMEKNKSQDDELSRFRAEAAALLGVTEHPTPATGKKEEKTPRQSKP